MGIIVQWELSVYFTSGFDLSIRWYGWHGDGSDQCDQITETNHQKTLNWKNKYFWATFSKHLAIFHTALCSALNQVWISSSNHHKRNLVFRFFFIFKSRPIFIFYQNDQLFVWLSVKPILSTLPPIHPLCAVLVTDLKVFSTVLISILFVSYS